MIDFHTHILPGIDDGSDSVKTAVELLRMLKEQGVDKVVLTPHFYAYSSSADDFIQRREDALDKLLKALKENPVEVELYMGCEVLYFDELWRVEQLKDFCIKGTDCILVEMPFSSWTDSMVRGIEKIIGKGLTPVLAHFERYLAFKGNREKIYEMINMGVVLQMNCAYCNKLLTRGKAVKYIREGAVFALGTDCHNLEDRCPDYLESIENLKKKLGEERLRRFVSKQKTLLRGAKKVYPDG